MMKKTRGVMVAVMVKHNNTHIIPFLAHRRQEEAVPAEEALLPAAAAADERRGRSTVRQQAASSSLLLVASPISLGSSLPAAPQHLAASWAAQSTTSGMIGWRAERGGGGAGLFLAHPTNSPELRSIWRRLFLLPPFAPSSSSIRPRES